LSASVDVTDARKSAALNRRLIPTKRSIFDIAEKGLRIRDRMPASVSIV